MKEFKLAFVFNVIIFIALNTVLNQFDDDSIVEIWNSFTLNIDKDYESSCHWDNAVNCDVTREISNDV